MLPTTARLSPADSKSGRSGPPFIHCTCQLPVLVFGFQLDHISEPVWQRNSWRFMPSTSGWATIISMKADLFSVSRKRWCDGTSSSDRSRHSVIQNFLPLSSGNASVKRR